VQATYRDPCRRDYAGIPGVDAQWVIGYKSSEDPPLQATQSIVDCSTYPGKCGEPPRNGFMRDDVYANYGPDNNANSASQLYPTAYDQSISFRFVDVEQMWWRFRPTAFEPFVSQAVSFTTDTWTVPQSGVDLAAARSALQLDTLASKAAREWINSQIDPQYASTTPDTSDVLLAQFAPELRYDSAEGYFVDSAAEATDNYSSHGTNRLKDTNTGNIIANSDPAADPNKPRLSLDFLGSTYSNGVSAQTTDRIVEDSDYPAAEARLHGQVAYADKMYGRVVPGSSPPILQYWFYYYYNVGQGGLGAGDHEGDWEMIQVMLDSSGNVAQVVAAQHNGGERCDWTHVQRTSDGRPIVYPAVGTHATYFSSGTHLVSGSALFDYANAGGPHTTPGVINIGSNPPGWVSWPGMWGNSAGSFPSPKAPIQQGDKWDNPTTWASGVSGCTEGQTYPLTRVAPGATLPQIAPHAQIVAPPIPTIRVHRLSKTLEIEYVFGRHSTAKSPWWMLTTIDGLGDRLGPQMTKHAIRRDRGELTVKLNGARGPVKLVLSVFAGDGARSTVQTLVVR
jgi:hypothetical protein